MNEANEYSEHGEPILRHSAREKPFEFAPGDPTHMELVEKHIARHFGEGGWVFHEIVSDLVHIDLHFIPPTPERNYHTVVTTGMSARPMTTPRGMEAYAYGELMLCLPPDWPVSQEAFEDENIYWPLRTLKTLCRLPHEYDTWLAYGHTIPNGDPPEPYAPNTRFCCAMLARPVLAPPRFEHLCPSTEMAIHFYAVLPLFAEEVDLKLKKGADALLERFQKNGVTELIKVNRKNVGKKLFGLF
jgi:hypothetical protein